MNNSTSRHIIYKGHRTRARPCRSRLSNHSNDDSSSDASIANHIKFLTTVFVQHTDKEPCVEPSRFKERAYVSSFVGE